MNVTATVLEATNATQLDLNDSLSIVKGSQANPLEVAVYIALEICIALFAFTNNALVLIALWKFRSLRTPTNWFVASLAVADIAVAIFAIPSAILLRLGLSINNPECNDVISGPSVGEGMCLVIISSVIFLTQVSIFGLLVIAIDRFIAINYPFKYNVFVTSNKTRAAILATWVLGGLIGVAPELGWNKWGGMTSNCASDKCAFEEIISMEYMVYFNFFGCVLIPLIAMGVMYLFIFRSAKKQLRKIYFDVKDMKRRKMDSRASEVVEQFKNAATLLAGGYYHGNKDHAKSQSHICSLAPTTEGDVHRETKGKFKRQSFSCTEISSGAKTMETAGNRSDSNIPAQTEDSQNIMSSSDFSVEEQEEAGNAYSNTKTAGECGRSNLFATKSRDSLQKITQRFRDRFKERSLSFHADNGNACTPVEIGETPTRECRLRPYGKAHSFSASSNVIQKPLNRKSRNTTYCIKARSIESGNDDACSLSSSRTTIYTNDHGVWSTVDGGNGNMQRKMKRKRQLLKKEFRAARSLATVVGLFALCWLPLHILNTTTLFCPTCYQPPWLKDLAILLSHANSLINPLIYAFKLRDFKKAFKRILAPIFQNSNHESYNLFSPKFCCFMTSPSQSSNDFSSDEKTASGDSWREKHAHNTPILSPKVEYTKNNNNISKNNSLGTVSGTSQGYTGRVTPISKTVTTLLGEYSVATINPWRPKSLPESVNECSSSSSEHLEMMSPSPMSRSDFRTDLTNSPETMV